MDILDFPSVLEITGHSITADHNAGQEVLPFSGTVQRLAPTLERFRATWTFKPPARQNSLEAEAFFLRVNSGAALFRTEAFQPCRKNPTFGGTVNGAHSARSNTLAVSGLPVNRKLEAGEWVQIGWQAARLLTPAYSDISGNATLTLFPFLHADLEGGEEVRVGRWVKILWRVVGEPVSWSYRPNRQRSLEVQLAAIQEIVTASHVLAGEEVPE